MAGNASRSAPAVAESETTIEVSNLFFNTPVRRKFLKTTQTEMGHIGEAFARIALARPDVQMKLTHNERVLHDLPATENWADRIHNFFGPDIGGSLIPVTSGEGEIRVTGYVVDPAHSRGNNRMQYLFFERTLHPRPFVATRSTRSLSRVANDGAFSNRIFAAGYAARVGRCECAPRQTGSSLSRGRTDLQSAARDTPQQISVDRPYSASSTNIGERATRNGAGQRPNAVRFRRVAVDDEPASRQGYS